MVTETPALAASSSSRCGLTMLFHEEMHRASSGPMPGTAASMAAGGFQNKFRRGEGAHQAHDPDRAKSRYQVQGDGGFLRCHGEGLISRYTSRWAWIMSLIL